MIGTPVQQIQARLLALHVKLQRHKRESQPSSPANLRDFAPIHIAATEAAIDELDWVLRLMLTLKTADDQPHVVLNPVDGGRALSALQFCAEQFPDGVVAVEMTEVRDKILAQVASWESEEVPS